MGALGLMILFVGCLATGATRHKVYRAWRARVGGRISCAVVCSDFVLYTDYCSEYRYLENCMKKTFWFICKVKVKCTLVQALRLCTGRTAHGGSRGIALLFLDHGTRRGWGVSVTPRPLCTPGKDPVSIVQEAGWAPGPVWTGVENPAPTRIRSPDRPAHSQSLYRQCYPAHLGLFCSIFNPFTFPYGGEVGRCITPCK